MCGAVLGLGYLRQAVPLPSGVWWVCVKSSQGLIGWLGRSSTPSTSSGQVCGSLDVFAYLGEVLLHHFQGLVACLYLTVSVYLSLAVWLAVREEIQYPTLPFRTLEFFRGKGGRLSFQRVGRGNVWTESSLGILHVNSRRPGCQPVEQGAPLIA